MRSGLVKRRTATAQRLDCLVELLGPSWGDLLGWLSATVPPGRDPGRRSSCGTRSSFLLRDPVVVPPAGPRSSFGLRDGTTGVASSLPASSVTPGPSASAT